MVIAKKEVLLMLIEANGLSIVRLLPEEVERLLAIQFGNKLVAVDVARVEKQTQKRIKSAVYFQKRSNKTNSDT